MNRRERIILALTVVVGVVGLIFYFMPEEGLSGGDGAAVGGVEEARREFEESFRYVRSEPAILAAYERVNTQIPEKQDNSTPESTFSNEVAKLLEGKGWERPAIKPGKPVEIKGVSDYYYIDLDMTLSGPRQKIMNVLVDFDQQHLMIKSFQLDKKNMDSDNVDLKVTVSRLARAEPDETPKKSKRRITGGSADD